MRQHHITIEFTSVQKSEGGEDAVIAHTGSSSGDIVWIRGLARWGVLDELHSAEKCFWSFTSFTAEEFAEEVRSRLFEVDGEEDGIDLFMPVLGAASQ